jgi:hypothetical protein
MKIGAAILDFAKEVPAILARVAFALALLAVGAIILLLAVTTSSGADWRWLIGFGLTVWVASEVGASLAGKRMQKAIDILDADIRQLKAEVFFLKNDAPYPPK